MKFFKKSKIVESSCGNVIWENLEWWEFMTFIPYHTVKYRKIFNFKRVFINPFWSSDKSEVKHFLGFRFVKCNSSIKIKNVYE